jgi:hypothetical protein
MMLESNLAAGNQKNSGALKTMDYGVSITDACIDWETTEQLIESAHEQLGRMGNQVSSVCQWAIHGDVIKLDNSGVGMIPDRNSGLMHPSHPDADKIGANGNELQPDAGHLEAVFRPSEE